MKPSEPKLTVKQKIFVDAYLGSAFFNATEAARIAGLKHPNTQGPRLLVNVRVKNLLKERLDESAISANEVLARLSKQSRGSLGDVLNEDGEFDIHDARKRKVDDLLKKLKLHRTIRRTREGEEIESISYEYEIHDSQAALVHLGRFHKLFVDRQEVTGKDGNPLSVVLESAIKKAYGDSDDS